jgi:hypothetical protein
VIPVLQPVLSFNLSLFLGTSKGWRGTFFCPYIALHPAFYSLLSSVQCSSMVMQIIKAILVQLFHEQFEGWTDVKEEILICKLIKIKAEELIKLLQAIIHAWNNGEVLK